MQLAGTQMLAVTDTEITPCVETQDTEIKLLQITDIYVFLFSLRGFCLVVIFF